MPYLTKSGAEYPGPKQVNLLKSSKSSKGLGFRTRLSKLQGVKVQGYVASP